MGVCGLSPDFHAFRESELALFQKFAEFVCHAFAAQSKTSDSRFVTMKTIFTQLLQCLPVSQKSMERALDSMQRNSGCPDIRSSRWICIVIRSANRQKTLPHEYLCAALESMLPDGAVTEFENSLAAFCIYPEEAEKREEMNSRLLSFLQDMNFRAGISEAFTNLFDAHIYYVQA